VTAFEPVALPAGFSQDVGVFFNAWRGLRHGALMPRLSDYLDAAPARLQPFVSIVDVHGPDKVLVRLFGTGLAAIAGQDFTKKDFSPIYAAQELARVGAIAWQAVNHPAGYFCMRTVRASNGLVLDCDCICLPLALDQTAPKCMITFVHLPAQLPRLPQTDAVSTVTAVRFISWLDIGAGTPNRT
jgi:hypothetical protein